MQTYIKTLTKAKFTIRISLLLVVLSSSLYVEKTEQVK